MSARIGRYRVTLQRRRGVRWRRLTWQYHFQRANPLLRRGPVRVCWLPGLIVIVEALP